MITYKGKSYVSDKMLNGECQGIHWTGAMVSDVNPATRLNGMCLSVMMGEKNIYGVDKSLLELLVQYPALGELLAQYPALGELLVQDNDLVHSLIDTGYERWLVSDIDNPYIDFGQTWQEANYTLDIEFKHLHNQSANQVYIFGSQRWSGGALLIHDRMNPPYSLYPNTGSFEDLGDGTYIVRLASSGKNEVGGTNKVTLFGGNISQKGLVRISYFRGSLGENQYHLVPFKKSTGECGMLNLINLQFHPNVNTEGTFTIELTPKV